MDKPHTGDHKKKRPTREEQIRIQKNIQLYYNRGLSIEEVHRLTGYNSKTISKYFNKLSDEIEKSETQNIIERERNERRRVILCYRHLMCEEYQMLDDINAEIKKFKKNNQPVPAYFLSKHNETVRTISILNEKIGSFIMQPTLDETLDKMIEDRLKKNEESNSKK